MKSHFSYSPTFLENNTILNIILKNYIFGLTFQSPFQSPYTLTMDFGM